MREFLARYWKRIVAGILAVVLIAGMCGQYTLWQRYGVFSWWSEKPRFLEVNGRGYKRGADRAPEPHYCQLSTMFPFDYPIAAATSDGPDGKPCPGGTPTGVYLLWKDGNWTVYGLLGGQ